MRKLVVLSILAAAFGGLGVAAPVTAVAAESHVDCVTFDDSGNILSVVPNCSETFAFAGGAPQPMAVPGACGSGPGTIVLYPGRQVFHVNVDGAGDIWLTGTQNGSAAFVPEGGDVPTYTGTFTAWFGGQLNNKNMSFEDTFSLRLASAAGAMVTMHFVDHTTITPSGAVNGFPTKIDVSCG